MKKKLFGCLLAGVLAIAMTIPVLADNLNGGDDFVVDFTSRNHLDTNYTNNDFTESITGLQPGDTVTYKFTLKNSNKDAVYYYMSSSVIQAFEDSDNAPTGGSYGYELTYYDTKNTETVLYRSHSIGGDGAVDFKTAGNNFSDYVFLDTMKTGESGKLVLKISLDGETDGNAYQSSVAKLNMSFAVETGINPDVATPTPAKNDKATPVKTGDYSHIYLYAIIGIVAGLILLIIAIIKLKRDKKEEEDEQEFKEA